MANTISWEKWKDPYRHLLNRASEAGGGLALTDQDEHFMGPCVITRLGVIPLHEDNLPSDTFQFYVGHTNFELTHHLARKMQEEPGVESLDVLSRYRFRIGIARNFSVEAVKKAIEICVNARSPYEAISNFLRNTCRGWALVKMPSGTVSALHGDNAVVQHNLRLLTDMGAQLLSSSWRDVPQETRHESARASDGY